MKRLIIPAKFSILALISSGKATIFEDIITDFLEELLDKEFDN